MILQSHANFDQLASLDPDIPSIQFFSRKHHPGSQALIAGSFSLINEMMVSLYRMHGNLYFRIAHQEFEVTDDVSSQLEVGGVGRKFRLLKGENVLVELTYITPEFEIPLSDDPTPFVEPEHFDFLLFVHNVLTEPGRRNRVWNQSP